MNSIQLIGRLTRDPELRTTESGKTMCNFDIAVNRIGSDEADFINCQVWGQTAENLFKYQSKGMMIGVNGSYRVQQYKNKDGDTRYSHYVVANSIEYLSTKKEEKTQEEKKTPAMKTFEEFADEIEITDDDLPF